MRKKIQYHSEEEKEALIAENSSGGFFLYEYQTLLEGDFLVFGDNAEEFKSISNVTVPEVEFNTLKTDLSNAQQAIDFLLMGGM